MTLGAQGITVRSKWEGAEPTVQQQCYNTWYSHWHCCFVRCAHHSVKKLLALWETWQISTGRIADCWQQQWEMYFTEYTGVIRCTWLEELTRNVERGSNQRLREQCLNKNIQRALTNKRSKGERASHQGRHRFGAPTGLAGSTAVTTNQRRQSWRSPQDPQLRQLLQGLGPSLPCVMGRRWYGTESASAGAGTGCIVCKQRGGQNKISCFTKDATRYPKKKRKTMGLYLCWHLPLCKHSLLKWRAVLLMFEL